MEFFPDGHNNTPDGKAGSLKIFIELPEMQSEIVLCQACLRLFIPPQVACCKLCCSATAEVHVLRRPISNINAGSAEAPMDLGSFDLRT